MGIQFVWGEIIFEIEIFFKILHIARALLPVKHKLDLESRCCAILIYNLFCTAASQTQLISQNGAIFSEQPTFIY